MYSKQSTQEVKIFARPATPMANPVGSIVIDLDDDLFEGNDFVEQVINNQSTGTQGWVTGLAKRLVGVLKWPRLGMGFSWM